MGISAAPKILAQTQGNGSAVKVYAIYKCGAYLKSIGNEESVQTSV